MEKKEQLLLIEPQNELKFIGEYVCAKGAEIFGEPEIEMHANEKPGQTVTKKWKMPFHRNRRLREEKTQECSSSFSPPQPSPLSS